jgi:hypothetical protein
MEPAESSSGRIGLITLDAKCTGARSAGNPHAACEVEGAGNGVLLGYRASSRPNRLYKKLDFPINSI